MELRKLIIDKILKRPSCLLLEEKLSQQLLMEGLKAFLSQGILGEKPFLEFLKAFPDLKVIGKTFPPTSKTFPSR